MAKCRTCGKYNDVFEWPEEDRPNYVPHLCYACYQEKLNQPEEDETPDAEDEFGMGEIKPNPDDDDSPIIPDDEEQSDNNICFVRLDKTCGRSDTKKFYQKIIEKYVEENQIINYVEDKLNIVETNQILGGNS